jgi:cell division protein ZapA (FtsZ GTPase activity inhibitor)
MPEYESVPVEICGVYVRVRVPASQVADVKRAAQVVRDRIDQLRKPQDPLERVLVRAALEVAYESRLHRTDIEDSLERLVARLTEALAV